MSGKVKMKCARCGKRFKSSQATQTLCPDCLARERHARAAGAAASAKLIHTAATPPPPKIVGPGAAILIPGLASPHAEPSSQPALGQAPAPSEKRGAAATPAQGPHHGTATAEKPARSSTPAKASTQPKPPREPREPRQRTPPFELTDELRARIEARYLELAQPVEFDGIRTQIAGELSIPKVAIKRVVHDLRARMQLPSWWDLRAYSGTPDDLARIRAAYEPLLPVPPVGIHKQIAVDLGLDPMSVYHGIRRVRAELRLPQYNPPELHPELPPPTFRSAAASAPAT
jgi:hypothetical protein